jgi:alkylmercury lyase
LADATGGRSAPSLARPVLALRPRPRPVEAGQPEISDPPTGLLTRASDDASAVRRAAFARLRGGAAVTSSELAADTRLSARAIEAALAELVASGWANVNESGHVVAVGGLSVQPAAHELFMDGLDFWTWCAFDAVGIPAALRVDAIAGTHCGQCAEPIGIAISRGTPQRAGSIVGWLPGRQCENVQHDFCRQANLFCNDAHLAEWRAAAGDAPGRMAGLIELAAHGRDVWAEMRTESGQS